jgi:adenosylcobinamide-phosphate synthase
MTWIALIVALALEQLRPLGQFSKVWRWFEAYVAHLKTQCNAGKRAYVVLAWVTAVVPLTLLAWLVYIALHYFIVGQIWATLWCVFVLYFTMGFRHFSGQITAIREALLDNQIFQARLLLSEWTGRTNEATTANQIARKTIEMGVLDSYHHVFATIFWFSVLPGPMGAVLYRLSYQIAKQWRRDNPDDDFAFVAHKMLATLDYIPTRLTAMSFALMGNFEEAVYYWRAQVAAGRNHARHLLIASAEGALGIRLSDQEFSTLGNDRPVLGLGERFEPLYLQSAVSLIWRALVLWLAVIGLMNIQSGVMIVFN